MIRRIKEDRETEFFKVAITELRDKLEEKLQSSKLYDSQIQQLNKLDKQLKSGEKTTKEAKEAFPVIVQSLYE